MKRILIIAFLFLSTVAAAQVINFGKTLPLRSFSIGTAVSNHIDNQNSDGGISLMAFGGFPLNYSTDVSIKYSYFPGADYLRPSYFGADIQILFKETRRSYFTFIGGGHYHGGPFLDLTGTFTYTPEFWLNLTAALDLEVGQLTDYNYTTWRAWVALNAGFNIGNIVFIFLEYDLPVNEGSWDIISLGANFVIR